MPGRPVPRVRSCLRSLNDPQRRAYALEVLRGSDLGPTEQNDYQTFRVRKDGSKLPLPPGLDPIVVEQKTRWTQQKNKPDFSKHTPFQKKLQQNAYAHSLASPVRVERSTTSLLPSDFLICLNLAPHPETSKPWLLPLSLSSSKPPKTVGPPLRFLANEWNAAYLGSKKAHWRPAIERRFTAVLGDNGVDKLVWRDDMTSLVRRLLQDRVVDKLAWWFGWRGRLTPVASALAPDLEAQDDVSCVLMRGSLATRADKLLEEAEEIGADVDKWAVYFRAHFGSYFDPHCKPLPSSGTKPTHIPPHWYTPLVPRLSPRALYPPLHFPTTRWRGKKVAVYSLTDMLGEEKATKLVGHGGTGEGERCWIMKRNRHNVPVELLLMQLQSYLAKPGPVWEP